MPARCVEIADTETEPHDLPLREIARARGFRSLLYVPLMSKGTAIGVIGVTRRNPGPFSAHHVELLQTFADQAVIAIENVRLFNETQEGAGAADRDGRHPQGHRQFAVERAAGVRSHRREREPCLSMAIRAAVHRIVTTTCSPAGLRATATRRPMRSCKHRSSGRSAGSQPGASRSRSGSIVHVIDDADVECWPNSLRTRVGAIARLPQHAGRAAAARRTHSIGVDHRLRAQEARPVRPTSTSQLLQTFADQAVIAIENVAAVQRGAGKTRDLARR